MNLEIRYRGIGCYTLVANPEALSRECSVRVRDILVCAEMNGGFYELLFENRQIMYFRPEDDSAFRVYMGLKGLRKGVSSESQEPPTAKS